MACIRVTVLVLALVLGLPVVASGAVPAGGLQGVVKQPQNGMCLAGDPCDGVGRGILLVFTRTGQVPHRVRSDADGRFRIRLAPGRYHVRGAVADTRTVPAYVAVPHRAFARVTITVFAAATMP
jgi:hypothetical protein